MIPRREEKMETVQSKVMGRIRRKPGRVFISKDFLDLGSREAVDQALSRLARDGRVRRLGRGLYDVPRVNALLGIALGPEADEVADAAARQTGNRVVPSGAVAANRLGLTTQVPAKPVYLTDGRTRTIRAGGLVLTVRHAAAKELPPGDRTAAMVIQALRHLGREAVDGEAVARLRKAVPPEQARHVLRDTRYAAEWINEVVREAFGKEEARG
ncbi:MAG: hypothetical protein K2W96_05280 [Gemmataceae bacterium]|nr:hypothetical protein [Gemmataceae bacterium]